MKKIIYEKNYINKIYKKNYILIIDIKVGIKVGYNLESSKGLSIKPKFTKECNLGIYKRMQFVLAIRGIFDNRANFDNLNPKTPVQD